MCVILSRRRKIPHNLVKQTIPIAGAGGILRFAQNDRPVLIIRDQYKKVKTERKFNETDNSISPVLASPAMQEVAQHAAEISTGGMPTTLLGK